MLFWQSGNLVLTGFHNITAIGRVRHAIATRLGGSSEAPYRGLNLGLRSGDDPARVVAHRSAFCAALDLAPEQVAAGRQVHGDGIAAVTRGDLAEGGRGLLEADRAIPDVDALITREPGVGLFLLVADCTPVVVCDPVLPAVALIHAGWRGTAKRVVEKAVGRLVADFGCRPTDLVAGIGPAIGPCCYEVDDPVIEGIRAAHPEDATDLFAMKANGRAQLDLAEANLRQLLAAGVRPDAIEMSGNCTACTTTLFYSERREGRPSGRFGALIVISDREDRQS